jgi:hypothetical protein
MWQDWLESVIIGLLAGLLGGLLWAALLGFSWLIIAKYLRRRELDSDYEHVNHNRHGKAYRS